VCEKSPTSPMKEPYITPKRDLLTLLLRSAAEKAEATLQHLARKLRSRLEQQSVPLNGGDGWRGGGGVCATAAAMGLPDGPHKDEVVWHLEAIGRVEVALDGLREAVRTAPKDVNDYYIDADAGVAVGASVRHSCLQHLRQVRL